MKSKTLIRTIIAALIGEMTLVLSTFVAQEVVVKGVHLGTSSTADLILGGSATLVAGIFSGLIAALIGGSENKWPQIIISCLIVIETAWLISNDRLNNPIWFGIVSASLLVLSVLLGGYLFRRWKR